MSAVEDAAILYLALHGWGDPLRCCFIEEDGEDFCSSPDVVGISAEDGYPLCSKHVGSPEDNGHRLDPKVIARIKELRREYYEAAGEECVE